MLKIVTPNKLLTRLPVLLAQMKAENNSCKLKNKIRKRLYLLYQQFNYIFCINNLIQLLRLGDLYFYMLMFCSITELMVQPNFGKHVLALLCPNRFISILLDE